jgi:hypothetical protein
VPSENVLWKVLEMSEFPEGIPYFGIPIITSKHIPKDTAYVMNDPWTPGKTVIIKGIGPKPSRWKRFWSWLKKETVLSRPVGIRLKDPSYMEGYGMGYKHSLEGTAPEIDLNYPHEIALLKGYQDGYHDGGPNVRPCS